ncbi:MAG: cellulase family glycosylhydrolase [Pirellulales bacterium]
MHYRIHGSLTAATVIGLLSIGAVTAAAQSMPRIAISDDGKSFVLAGSGERFVPWGFNYDHDREGRLLEDYWLEQWPTIEEDFAEMKRLGANVVRVHLQLGKFMDAADRPSERSLAQLDRLLGLAEREGLYLDITGLGCYHKHDVPPWYDELDRDERWAVQARFWEAVASRCASSPAVFCYDLMNEPVVPGGSGRRDDWLGPAFAGKHFVQFIARETGGRPRVEIAREWTSQLVEAIRGHDRGRLITVGLVPWSLDRPGLTSGFVPSRIAPLVDFVAVHIYPESGKLDEARATLEAFDMGKPLLVEETFPLKCSPEELGKVIDGSRDIVDGWIGFYWGTTPEELKESESIADALTRGWLELFQEKADEIKGP